MLLTTICPSSFKSEPSNSHTCTLVFYWYRECIQYWHRYWRIVVAVTRAEANARERRSAHVLTRFQQLCVHSRSVRTERSNSALYAGANDAIHSVQFAQFRHKSAWRLSSTTSIQVERACNRVKSQTTHVQNNLRSAVS